MGQILQDSLQMVPGSQIVQLRVDNVTLLPATPSSFGRAFFLTQADGPNLAGLYYIDGAGIPQKIATATDVAAGASQVGPAVANIAALEALTAGVIVNRQQRLVTDSGATWQYDSSSTTTVNGTTVANGPSGVGRWIRISSGAGATNHETLAGLQGGAINDRYHLTATQYSYATSLTGIVGTMAYQNASAVALTGGSINGVSIGGITPSSGAFTTLSSAGTATLQALSVTDTTTLGNSVTINGVGRRVLADFSNATLASRLMFQSATDNNQTNVGAIPGAGNAVAAFSAYNASTVTNAASLYMGITATDAVLSSIAYGSGTVLPLGIYTAGIRRMQVSTTGSVAFGVDAPAARIDLQSVAGEGNGLLLNSRSDNTALSANLLFLSTTGVHRQRNISGALTFDYSTTLGGSWTESMRVTSAGILLVGKTASDWGGLVEINGTLATKTLRSIDPGANNVQLVIYSDTANVMNLEVYQHTSSAVKRTFALQPYGGTVTIGGNAVLTTVSSLNASNLSSGTVPAARLGSGTPSTTTFLRGDNTWAIPSGSGSSDVANVKTFGAVGDGVNDDTAAIQAAINAVGYRRVYFPAGVYRVRAVLTCTNKNLFLYGDGSNSSIIVVDGSGGPINGLDFNGRRTDLDVDQLNIENLGFRAKGQMYHAVNAQWKHIGLTAFPPTITPYHFTKIDFSVQDHTSSFLSGLRIINPGMGRVDNCTFSLFMSGAGGFRSGSYGIYMNTYLYGTVTFDATTNVFTRTGHGMVLNEQVVFEEVTAGSGLSPWTAYYAINLTTDTFQLANTPSGSPIDVLLTGSGTASNGASTDVTIQSCIFDKMETASYVGGLIEGVHWLSCTLLAPVFGINVDLSEFLPGGKPGMYVRGCHINTPSWGVHFKNVSQWILSDNLFYSFPNQAAYGPYYQGIFIESAIGSNPDVGAAYSVDGIIKGNIFMNAGGYGAGFCWAIHIAGSNALESILITDNRANGFSGNWAWLDTRTNGIRITDTNMLINSGATLNQGVSNTVAV